MSNFWDTSVWGFVCMSGSILLSLLLANGLKRLIKVLQKSLIPTSVVAGLILGGIAALLLLVTGKKKRGEYFAYGPCFTIIALLAALS